MGVFHGKPVFYGMMCNRQEADVSLSRNTAADWVCEMATDLKTESIEKGKDLFPYSLVDETTDTTGTAHLVIFLRGVDSNLFIMEEILDIKLIHGTTAGKDLFEKICQCVTDIKLPWDKLVGLTTDGALAMYSKKNGLVGRIRLKMQGENCAEQKEVFEYVMDFLLTAMISSFLLYKQFTEALLQVQKKEKKRRGKRSLEGIGDLIKVTWCGGMEGDGRGWKKDLVSQLKGICEHTYYWIDNVFSIVNSKYHFGTLMKRKRVLTK
ncbi:Hypothetical predicted protein [Octopus vulgaris]|uniref:DUF4371 domain-containing protein n=1 Tax=Octopus vulgaris TaxID=6645 RepID=A0AA36F3P0_OCTVU|nr:Hypothetical predicted protein [Octopus vulgaris]